MKYEIYDYGRNAKIVNVVDEKGELVALAENRQLAEYMVGILNQETKSLSQEIARLKALVEDIETLHDVENAALGRFHAALIAILRACELSDEAHLTLSSIKALCANVLKEGE